MFDRRSVSRTVNRALPLRALRGAAAADSGGPADHPPIVMSTGTGPVQTNFYAAELYANLHPGVMPAGTNDPNRRPSVARPRPVLLFPGWVQSAYGTFSMMADQLQADGACVYTLQTAQQYAPLPIWQSGDPFAYADTMQRAVAQVRAVTGARQVDVVAFSQAITIGLYYVKFLGGHQDVNTFVAYSGTPHGFDAFGLIGAAEALTGRTLAPLYGLIPPLRGYDPGGPMVTKLYDSVGPTVPEVQYVAMNNAVTRIVPDGGELPPAANVRNIRTTDLCPAAFSSHLGYPYDPYALRVLRNVLDPANSVEPVCRLVLPQLPF
ncbi:hypothetical protein JGU71_06480 [Antrihabitans sp. YC3-6]|uniref:Lipase n=1 Tax=Antrihabitans stalagmiti TaxID=2799499 RepID=A0A934U2Z7_9NOCA|nr:hypothetical protein [Antrihabitans stalagmiti]MBJ8338523.1 hypothetical protein [Antrihabitans stalagmiti]